MYRYAHATAIERMLPMQPHEIFRVTNEIEARSLFTRFHPDKTVFIYMNVRTFVCIHFHFQHRK